MSNYSKNIFTDAEKRIKSVINHLNINEHLDDQSNHSNKSFKKQVLDSIYIIPTHSNKNIAIKNMVGLWAPSNNLNGERVPVLLLGQADRNITYSIAHELVNNKDIQQLFNSYFGGNPSVSIIPNKIYYSRPMIFSFSLRHHKNANQFIPSVFFLYKPGDTLPNVGMWISFANTLKKLPIFNLTISNIVHSYGERWLDVKNNIKIM